MTVAVAGRRRASRRSGQAAAGSALLIVLWMTAVLALIAASFVRTSRVDALTARNAADLSAARLLADAGARQGILMLVDALRDGRLASARAAPVADGERRLPLSRDDELLETDGIPYQWRFHDAVVEIAFVSEAGKVNLNLAPLPILRAGFEALGASNPDELASDTDLLRRSIDDRDAGLAATGRTGNGRKQLAFRSVGDLAAIAAFPRERVEAARDVFTIYSKNPTPDIEQAPPRLLAVLGLSPHGGGGPGAVPRLVGGVRASGGTLSAFPEAGNGSDLLVYTIRAKAESGRATFAREAVVELVRNRDTPYRIYRWGQGELGSAASPR